MSRPYPPSESEPGRQYAEYRYQPPHLVGPDPYPQAASANYYPSQPPHSSQSLAYRPPPAPYPPQHQYPPSLHPGPSRVTNSPRSHPAYPQPYQPPASTSRRAVDHGDEEGEDASSEEDATTGEKQKLEVKREKNRLKQRNLRIRRANHVSTLEASLDSLEKKHKLLEEQYDEVRRREAGLEHYVASLEAILQRHGLWDEVRAGGVRPGVDINRAEDREREGKRRRVEGGVEPSGDVGEPHERDPNRLVDTSDLGKLQRTRSLSSFAGQSSEAFPPRTSMSHSLPDSQSSQFISAPSPRSMRIEDLLSPSLQAEVPPLPLHAYSFNTSKFSQARRQSSLGQEAGMLKQGSTDSVVSKSAASTVVEDSPATRHWSQSIPAPNTISAPPLHPSVHTARVLLRAILADQAHIPISQCLLPPLTPSQQTIILNAIYNLTTSAFRDKVIEEQIQMMPAALTKVLLGYSHSSTADLRIVLMPIAILRARVVGFLKDQLPFDVTAFVSHVLADGRIFGDTADPAAWEMSDMFWDVWGGWFKAGRKQCSSLSAWRRRHGHTGSNVIEILLGQESEGSRMSCLIGQPEGWKRPVLVPDANRIVT